MNKIQTIRIFLILLLVLLFIGLVVWGYFDLRRRIENRGGETATEAAVTPAAEVTDETGEFATVKRVIDGDTVELENGERVRYIGIDTPETLDPRKPVQCFGREATGKNEELVEGKKVRLEKDVTDRDKYRRLLRYVYVGEAENETFINLELVKQGFAHSYTYPPDVKYQDLFVAAEKEARENNRGLWNSCPVVSPTMSLSPTAATNSATGGVSENCVIKGNISANGEKIYHLPGCGSYEKTSIDESRGEKWFCSEDEAVFAGWRKAKNCS